SSAAESSAHAAASNTPGMSTRTIVRGFVITVGPDAGRGPFYREKAGPKAIVRPPQYNCRVADRGAMTMFRREAIGGIALLLFGASPAAGDDLAAQLRDLNATVIPPDSEQAKQLPRMLARNAQERLREATQR